MSVTNILIVVDALGATHTQKLQEHVLLTSNNTNVSIYGSTLESKTTDGNQIVWKVAAIDDKSTVSIVGFGGPMVIDKICRPSKDKDRDGAWECKVNTSNKSKTVSYVCMLEVNGTKMAFGAELIVKAVPLPPPPPPPPPPPALEILLVPDTVITTTKSSFNKALYLFDTKGKETTYNGRQIMSKVQAGQQVIWRINPLRPTSDTSIVSFTGDMITKHICKPVSVSIGKGKTVTYWSGVIPATVKNGSYSYTCHVSVNGNKNYSYKGQLKVVKA